MELSWTLASELAVPNQPLGTLTLGARLLHDAKELRGETTPIAPTTAHGKLVKRELLAAACWAQAAGEMMDAANADLSQLIKVGEQIGPAAL